MEGVREALRTVFIWEVNGWLVTAYVLWEHAALGVTLAACLVLLRDAPREQRPWMWGAAALAGAAAAFAPAPVPVLLSAMSVAAALAVRFDRFNPDALRWRTVGGLALYAAAALAYLAYGRYLAAVDASAWAAALGGEGEAAATLAQGRAFLNTLATWGLWLILPLGFFSLLAQGLLAHPPAPATPEETIARVHTRGRDMEA